MSNLQQIRVYIFMTLKKYYVLLFLLPLFAFTTHKYYLSLTQIKFNEDAKAVQIIINVFMDDIENAINKDYNIDLQLTTKKELKNNDVYFEKYLNRKLAFKINNQPKSFSYIGKEYEGDLVYFYIEIEHITAVSSIEIDNKILLNHYPTQQNLVKSKVGQKNKSVLLTKDKYKETLKF